MKKIFLIAAILVAMVALLTIGASAETVGGNCSEHIDGNVTWSLDTKTGTITISGTGAMENFTSTIDTPWRSCASLIKNVIIGEGVTNVGKNAFSMISTIESVSLASTVTSIGDSAFYNCPAISSVTLSANLSVIDNAAFERCSSLKSITIPANVTEIKNYAFASSGLTEVKFADGSKLESIGNYAFNNLSSLSAITFPESLKTIGQGAFANCKALTVVNIPKNVASIGRSAFYSSGLTSVTVDADNKSYHTAGNCLIETGSGTVVLGFSNSVIPQDGTVKAIGYQAFMYLDISSITLPESLVTIDSYAFGYTPLTSVSIPANTETISSYAFAGCEAMETVTFAENSKLTTVGDGAFYQCIKLNTITLPDTVTSMGYRAFAECESLKAINIPKSLTVLGDQVLSRCINLENIVFADDCALTTVNAHALDGCVSIGKLVFPKSVTSISSFQWYESYSELGVEEGNTVYHSEGNCIIETATSTLILGCKNSVIPSDVKYIGELAFGMDPVITSITIPANVKSIGYNAFAECESLESVIFADNSTLTLLDNSAFTKCESLKSIVIPESVKNVGDSCFARCTSLESVTFLSPETVIYSSPNTIPYSAFGTSATIFGHALSTAKNYANAYARQFIPICEYENIAGVAHLCTPASDTSPATYYESCPVCGVNGTETFTSRLDSFSINLGKDISINYNIIPAAEDADKEIYLKFHMNGNEYILTDYTEKNSQLTFSFHITPQCIGETINAEIYIGGIKYQFVEDCGVLSYCERILALSNTDLGITEAKYAQLKTLIGDLLAYGAAAQDYINYKPDSKPSISGVSPSEFIPLTSTDISISSSTVIGLNFDSATLRFNNVNNLIFNFKASDTTGVTVRINGVDAAYTCTDEENSIYTVTSSDIYAKNFGEVYTVELLKDGEVAQTLNYSIKSYVYSKQSKTDEQGEPTPMATLAQRTWNYGLSAKAYAEN